MVGVNMQRCIGHTNISALQFKRMNHIDNQFRHVTKMVDEWDDKIECTGAIPLILRFTLSRCQYTRLHMRAKGHPMARYETKEVHHETLTF